MKENVKTLKHKGYIGSIEISLEDDYLHGKILFIKDRVIYGGENLKELKQSFIEAVDDYLEFCEEIGKTPDITCNGNFNVRLTPELHYESVRQAYHKGMSLNAYVASALETQTQKDKSNHDLSEKLNNLSERLLKITAKINYKFSSDPIVIKYKEDPIYPIKSIDSVVYETYGSMC